MPKAKSENAVSDERPAETASTDTKASAGATSQADTHKPSQGPHAQVVLASGSPRRRELLEQHGVEFTVRVSEVDETLDPELLANPVEAVQQLAERKAGVVVQEILTEISPKDDDGGNDDKGLDPKTLDGLGAKSGTKREKAENDGGPESASDQATDADRASNQADDQAAAFDPTRGIVVIGADTMVVLDGQIFGKPANFSHAKGMLRKLSGRTHQVMTGVSLWAIHAPDPAHPQSVNVGHRKFVDISDVTFRQLSDDEIDAYLAKGESYDKAGAYAVQGEGAALVEKVDGHLDTVIGLPAARMVTEFPDLLGLA